MVAVKGWTSVSDSTAIDFAREIEKANPVAVIFTDIAKDGMLQGPGFSSILNFFLQLEGSNVSYINFSYLVSVLSIHVKYQQKNFPDNILAATV